tara:strand:+ start:961 stop:1251 length:291 start_codon:yes stop_codon:yes gene_type:complete
MKAEDIIKKSLKKINSQLKGDQKIKKYDKNFQIFGPKSKLDSLIIVNLFLEVESIIKKTKKKEINLLTDNFFEKGFKFKYCISNLEKDIKKKIKGL